MASAKNKVIKGEYEGNRIEKIPFEDRIKINMKGKPDIELTKYIVKSYEVITEETLKSGTSAVLRGAFGAFLLGPAGLLAGLSAKNKGIYLIAIKFRSGSESLIEIDDKLFKIFKQIMYESEFEKQAKNSKKFKGIRHMAMNQVDLDSPVEPIDVQVLVESDTDIPHLEINFRNLSNKVIKAIKFKAYCFNSFKEPVGTPPNNIIDFLIQDLSLNPKEKIKKAKVFSVSKKPTTRNINIVVEKVGFKDGTQWSREKAELKEINIPEVSAEKLNNLKTIAGFDSVTYPFEDEDSWTCVCGRYNKKDDKKCVRCDREKHKVFKNYNEDSIVKEIENRERKLDIEEEKRLREKERKKQEQIRIKKIKNKKIKKIVIATVTTFVLIIALYFLFTDIIIPNYNNKKRLEAIENNYNLGIESFDNDNFVKSASYLSGIIDYKDSESYLVGISEEFSTPDNFYKKIFLNKVLREQTDINLISAGSYHLIVINSNGEFITFGKNKYGEEDIDSWNNVDKISAGFKYTIGLKNDGTVLAIGESSFRNMDIEDWENIKKISAGLHHSVGLKEDGTVVAVGKNLDGQCNVEDWENIVEIDTGFHHTVALEEDGTVVAVGNNRNKERFIGSWENIVSVSAGNGFTLGLEKDGNVLSTGKNDFGQCDVSEWEDIIEISAGSNHAVGLKEDGTVVATGKNEHGQCDVSEWENIIEISAGNNTVGLKSDGSIVVAGNRGYSLDEVNDFNFWE